MHSLLINKQLAIIVNMKLPKNSTYDREYNILSKAQEHLSAKQLSVEDLWREYQLLSYEYKQLLNIAVKITGISDKYHKRLMTAYEDLEKQNIALEDAAALREEMARITRHDLKTPLNGVIGFSSLLLDKDSGLNEEYMEMLNGIKDSGYQMLEMINRSHDLYKMETGNYQCQAEFVDVLVILKKIVNESKLTIESKKLAVEIKLNGKPAIENDTFAVKGEYLLCYSMFANLFKNAIEASPNRALVTISLNKEQTAIITIHNQGAIPKEIRSRFFEKYVTADKVDGTGLGTYSAKLMAETQGGSIHFDTSDFTGTTITVQLLITID